MYNSELKKLQHIVENEIPKRKEPIALTFEDTSIAEHSGELPVYIIDSFESDYIDEYEATVLLLVLQPSGNILRFMFPYSRKNAFCAKLLAFNGRVSGSYRKYAKLKVAYRFDQNNVYSTFIDDIDFINEETVAEGVVA